MRIARASSFYIVELLVCIGGCTSAQHSNDENTALRQPGAISIRIDAAPGGTTDARARADKAACDQYSHFDARMYVQCMQKRGYAMSVSGPDGRPTTIEQLYSKGNTNNPPSAGAPLASARTSPGSSGPAIAQNDQKQGVAPHAPYAAGHVRSSASRDPRLLEAKQLNRQRANLYHDERYQEALPVAQRVLDLMTSVLGDQDPEVASAKNNLALVYEELGQFAQAQRLYEQAVATFDKTAGPEDPSFPAALNNLGNIYQITGDYTKAEASYKRALPMYDRTTASNSPEKAKALGGLGLLYVTEGRYKEAEPLLRQALEVAEKGSGPADPLVGTTLNNLASLYENEGEYAKAQPLLERALTIDRAAFGADSPAVAKQLNNLGLIYKYEGRFSDAEPLLRQSLAIRERALVPDHPDVAESLGNLAALYQAQGLYTKAEPLSLRSVSIYEKALGATHPAYATAVTNLAELYHDEGQYSKAETQYKKALAIYVAILGADHPNVAYVMDGLGKVYMDEGRYADAEPLFKRSLVIRQQAFGSDSEIVGAALDSVAELYQHQGRYQDAEPLYQRALALYQRNSGPEKPDAARSMSNLAGLYADEGRYAEAEALYKRALAILEKTLGPDHPDVAALLDGLANLYADQGRYASAEPLARRAEAIREKALGPQHPLVANSLNNLANIYANEGRPEQAGPLLQRALAITEATAGPDSPLVATALGNLAMVEADDAAARDMFQRALAINEKAFGPDSPVVAASLEDIALLDVLHEQYAQAQPLLERALKIREKSLGPENPKVADSLYNLGLLDQELGSYPAASSLYQRALTIREKNGGTEDPSVALTLQDLALLRWASNDVQGAVGLEARSADIEEHNLSIQLAVGSEREKLEYLRTISNSLSINIDLHLHGAPGDSKAAELALATILRRKGRALDAAANQMASIRPRLAPADAALLDELAAQRRIAANLATLGSGSGPDASSYRSQLTDANARLNELEREIASRSPAVAALTERVTVDSVRTTLPPNAALIELVSYMPFDLKARRNERWGARRYAAYVLQRDGQIRAVDLGDAKAIDRMVNDFGEALANPDQFDEPHTKTRARALDKAVMAPIRELLGNTRRLLIAPDGNLNLVPFAALVDEQNRYLVEQYSITYLTSGRDLLRMRTDPSRNGAPVIFANPAFTLEAAQAASSEPASNTPVQRGMDYRATHWDELPGTAEEAAALKVLMPRARTLEGQYATVTAVEKVAGPEILHIATHGFFDPDRPPPPPLTEPIVRKPGGAPPTNPLLLSGLVFAGANMHHARNDQDNGILTALEAAGLDLSGTQLVVLSACQTGLGQVKSGDGVYGLRRSFVLAGARSQLVTLWQVDDKVTKDFMVAFYTRLLAGEGRGDALRAVQLQMLTHPELRHPNDWAGFLTLGDWRNLKSARSTSIDAAQR